MKWMIYGAYGYTGELITHYAKRMGYSPVLAGRSKAKLESFAERVSLEARVFDLTESALKEHLQDIDLVVHCAGPFSVTAEPMMKACIATGTHYLDITGELEVFELAHSLRNEAEEAGVVLCPGVGFDVIPTDCIAARLKSQMPNATHLKLGFDSRSRMSRGTIKTSVQRLGEGGAVRKDSKIINVPLAYKTEEINFGDGKKLAMTIPWGDVSTAFYTTGVPNIEVYVPASPKLVKRLKRLNHFRWFFRLNIVRNWLANKANKQPAGPELKEREKHATWVWGEISNEHGDTIALREKVVNGYTLTSRGAVELAIYVLRNQLKPGFYTPSRLYGAKLIDRFLAEK
ncbi:MAG TPA: saccharopine dehydrogenase NADP-binding domain-containing protein [Aliidiomarina sp.]|nr:saccharopine dehydrogenase NADP-binding domain-containing protein [Aliidiomarina sp.]